MFKILYILAFASFVLAKHEGYEGYGVYDVEVHSLGEILALQELKEVLNLDIWLFPTIERHGKIFVPPTLKENFQNALENLGIKYNLEVENIKEQLDLEDDLLSSASKKPNRTRNGGLSFDQIHTFEVVSNYLDDLAKSHPNLVSVESAGRSIEGRDIKYVKISTSNFQDTSKPVVFIQSLLHAREWVTLPVSLYAIRKLVHDMSDQELLQNIDWIILPVANPDGYVFTHRPGTNSRFWRKNRRSGTFCMGVDLNRNFDIDWGTASSNSACAETFHGRGPFSEPETAAIKNIFDEFSDRMELFVDVHSFGSMILYAYGDGSFPPNALDLHVVGVSQAMAIDRVKWAAHPNYRVGNIALTIGYRASGGCSDYAQSVNVPYSYAYELPGYNNLNNINGFLVDPDFIEQAGFESWEGIRAGAFEVLARRMREVQKRARL